MLACRRARARPMPRRARAWSSRVSKWIDFRRRREVNSQQDETSRSAFPGERARHRRARGGRRPSPPWVIFPRAPRYTSTISTRRSRRMVRLAIARPTRGRRSRPFFANISSRTNPSPRDGRGRARPSPRPRSRTRARAPRPTGRRDPPREERPRATPPVSILPPPAVDDRRRRRVRTLSFFFFVFWRRGRTR